MSHKRKKSCPICGKKVSRKRPPLDAGILTNGAWQKHCYYCGSLLWIPLDEVQPIECLAIAGQVGEIPF